MRNKFTEELSFYAKEGVTVSPETNANTVVGTKWASYFFDNLSPEGEGAHPEFERTLTALGAFYALLNPNQEEGYAYFIRAQRDLPQDDQPLTWDSFKEMSDAYQARYELPDANGEDDPNNEKQTNRVLLEYFVIYSDLAKTSLNNFIVKDLKLCPAAARGDDKILALLLHIKTLLDSETEENKRAFETIASKLPSLKKLNKAMLDRFITYYPLMTACFGHLYFAEAPTKMLETIFTALNQIPEEQREAALHFVLNAQELDGIGAAPTTSGSKSCTENFYQGYQKAINAILAAGLQKNLTIEAQVLQAFNNYYQQRWELTLPSQETMPLFYEEGTLNKNKDWRAYNRLVCLSRVFEPQKNAGLYQQYAALSKEDRELLAEAYGQFDDGFTFAPDYFATGFHNISKKARDVGDYPNEIKFLLNYALCFAKILKIIRPENICQETTLNFAKLSGYTAVRPNAFTNPQSFDPLSNIPVETWTHPLDIKDFSEGPSYIELVLGKGFVLQNQPQQPKVKLASSITLGFDNSSVASPKADQRLITDSEQSQPRMSGTSTSV
jgi:hypothetical protein